MNLDPYIFFTKCHRLYIQGMRHALRERLESAFGEDWWEKGVEHALPEEQRKHIQAESERNQNRDQHLLLDAAHFGYILTSNHNKVFSDAFSDSVRTFKEIRYLTGLRNEWAHIQDVSLVRARQAADLMKHILASLRCEEALEVERMNQDLVLEPDSGTAEEPIEDLGHQGDGFDTHGSTMNPLDFWRHLQSYLIVEKSVELPEDPSSDEARVIFRVHNTAPDSKDSPTVQFKSVVINASGKGEKNLREVLPGDTQMAEFRFPVKQLMAIDFEVFGEIDADKLFHFSRITNLPDEVMAPLKQEFVNQLESIAIKEFVNGILDAIGAPDPNMTLAEITRIRKTLKQQPEHIKAKQVSLSQLSSEFKLGQGSTIGARITEVARTLREFGEKLVALDEAIGHTDLDSINGAVSDLKQIQLAILRVEDAIRTMATNN